MDINIKKFKELMKNENAILLDTRTLEEFENGFIKNAINYDIFQVDFRDEILKLDRDKLYLVYCRSGGRSANAMEFMKANGFTAVYNLIGGVLAWVQNGNELVEEQE
ncbi:MAG: rhodanese-like domain-containing protein [Nanoarchaeales archaeon]|nr:rhodanese-like domain-containing protein [Nanoarchaeales archaeon]